MDRLQAESVIETVLFKLRVFLEFLLIFSLCLAVSFFNQVFDRCRQKSLPRDTLDYTM